jgi:signal transduction histidine kinase
MIASLLMAILVAATSHLPKTNTRAAIQAYVEDAAKVVQKSGPSCATFASPQWRGGEWYIFVDGPDDKIVCHLRADMIGKSPSSTTNAKGEKVGAMIMAKGSGHGKGWVEYLWAPPGKTAEELKSTYVMGVTGPDGKHYIVGAGGWNVKK